MAENLTLTATFSSFVMCHSTWAIPPKMATKAQSDFYLCVFVGVFVGVFVAPTIPLSQNSVSLHSRHARSYRTTSTMILA